MSQIKQNAHGLTRAIPDPITRQIRQNAGFGCVVCGDAIFQYEHIDPEFSDAKAHDPARITLLCGACHDKVTRGLWAKEKIKEAVKSPKCKQVGWSRFSSDLVKRFVVEFGSGFFVNPIDILRIEDRKVLSISPPEFPESPPLISALFCDRDGKEVASIVNNEWRGNANAFDIDCKGKQFKIRSQVSQVDLVITFDPLVGIRVESIDMLYQVVRIQGRHGSPFTVVSPKGELVFPSDLFTVENSNFCIHIQNHEIRLAVDPSFRFWGTDGERPIAVVVLGGCLRFVSYDEAGLAGDREPAMKPGEKVIKVTNTTSVPQRIGFSVIYRDPVNPGKFLMPFIWSDDVVEVGGSLECASLALDLLSPPRVQTVQRNLIIPKRAAILGIGRNHPCPCGSAREFKKCCGGR